MKANSASMRLPLPPARGFTLATARPRITKFSAASGRPMRQRSEEHTSELQSLTNLVCRLLLEKKKKDTYIRPNHSRFRFYLGSNSHQAHRYENAETIVIGKV